MKLITDFPPLLEGCYHQRDVEILCGFGAIGPIALNVRVFEQSISQPEFSRRGAGNRFLQWAL